MSVAGHVYLLKEWFDGNSDHISVRGAYVNNLKHLNVGYSLLNKLVAITGRSGSGKSSLAMGVLYAEGMRRYMVPCPPIPAGAMAKQVPLLLTQYATFLVPSLCGSGPTVPGIRSQLSAGHRSAQRHSPHVFPVSARRFVLMVTACRQLSILPRQWICPMTGESGMGMITCPTCGVRFMAFAAEDFAFKFNWRLPDMRRYWSGAHWPPTGSSLIKHWTIRQGAVASWRCPVANYFMPRNRH